MLDGGRHFVDGLLDPEDIGQHGDKGAGVELRRACRLKEDKNQSEHDQALSLLSARLRRKERTPTTILARMIGASRASITAPAVTS